jgi:transcriptional regulator with XRE-family HTH domain
MTRKPHPIISALREVRLASRISQDAIGASLGKRSNEISAYENGHPGRQSPRICTLEAWASALGYEIVLRPKE